MANFQWQFGDNSLHHSSASLSILHLAWRLNTPFLSSGPTMSVMFVFTYYMLVFITNILSPSFRPFPGIEMPSTKKVKTLEMSPDLGGTSLWPFVIGRPEKLWKPQSWRHSRPHVMGSWAAWCSELQSCLWQGVGTRWSLKDASNPSHSTIFTCILLHPFHLWTYFKWQTNINDIAFICPHWSALIKLS